MKKKMIIAAPPYGMAAIIKLTCVGVWLAQALGKTPVIWWGTSCLYSNNARENFYQAFFAPADPIEEEVYDGLLLAPGAMVYPNYWKNLDVLSLKTIDDNVPPNHEYEKLYWKWADAAEIKTADVCILHSFLSEKEAWAIAGNDPLAFDEKSFAEIINSIFKRFFKPKECILSPALHIYETLFKDSRRTIGIHYRGSDKVTESTIPSVKRHYQTAVKLGNGIVPLTVFVATDCERGLSEIRRRFGDKHRVVFQDYDRVSSVAVPLHYRKDTAFQNAIDIGVDVDILSRCDAVCGNVSSGVAWWVNNRRKSLEIDGKMVNVEPGFEDSISTILKLWKAFGFRHAMSAARQRVREWLVIVLAARGISKRRVSKFFNPRA